MIRFFRKSPPPTAPARTGGDDATDARRARARALLKRIAPLPLEEEHVLALRIQAWADSPVSDEEQWNRLAARAEDSLALSRSRQDELDMLVGKVRESLDRLEDLSSPLPEAEQARWRRWLADAAETVNRARPHDDTASLRSLLVELRDGEAALRAHAPVGTAPLSDPEWGVLRVNARRLLDEALRLVRGLPSDREARVRARLERLQRQFAEVMDLSDLRAARVLILHLEDTVEDIRGELADEEGRLTVVDRLPPSVPTGESLSGQPRRDPLPPPR